MKQEVIRKQNKAWDNKCEYIDRQIGGTRSSEAWKTINSEQPIKQTSCETI